MRELRTEIEIAAPATSVWENLLDMERYSTWNPFITQAFGRPETGEQLTIRLEPPGGSPMTFRPFVIKADRPREFRWLGRLILPGLFDGEHIFEIEEVADTRVRLIQREEFRGVLVPLLWKSLDTRTRAGFEAMNEALKDRAEKATREAARNSM
jgi:hypothetical protein